MCIFFVQKIQFLFKGFKDKRCFLPYVNTKISAQCPENYTINPDNVYSKIRYKELTKKSFSPVKGLEESSDKPEQKTSTDKQEAVQLYPQEINLKLRISE